MLYILFYLLLLFGSLFLNWRYEIIIANRITSLSPICMWSGVELSMRVKSEAIKCLSLSSRWMEVVKMPQKFVKTSLIEFLAQSGLRNLLLILKSVVQIVRIMFDDIRVILLKM